jgi:hypothetical protein
VGAAGHDASVVEVDHLVGQPDGGLAVGDHHQGRLDGVVAHAATQRRQDALLHLGVDRRGRVVEDQQPRPAHQRPGQGDALPLATRQGRAPLPQLGVEATGEGGHEAVGLGGAQGRPHLVVGHVGSQRDVAAHGVVEEERRLRNHRHRLRQRTVREVAQVDAVEAHRAGVRVDEPGQQGGQGALAGGGRADQGDRAAGVHLEGHLAEQRRLGLIGVGQPVDHEAGAAAVARQPALAVRHRAGGVDDPLDALEADHAAGEVAQQPADRPDREGHDREQVGHRHHVARVALAVEDPGDAHAQHHHDAEVGQGGQGRVEGSAVVADLGVDVAQLGGLGGEPLGLLGLAAEGLDHERPVEGLVSDLADLGAQLLGPRRPHLGTPLIDDVDDDHGGEDQQPDHRHHDVGHQHLDDGDHHHRQGPDRHRQRCDRPPGGLDVGVGVGQQLTGGVALVPAHRQREVLAGHGPTGVGLHPELHEPSAEPARDDADRSQQGDPDEERHDGDQQPRPDLTVAERRQHDVVGRPAEHPGVRHGQRAEQQASDGGGREDPRLPLDRDPENGEPLARRRTTTGAARLRHRGRVSSRGRRLQVRCRRGQRPNRVASSLGVWGRALGWRRAELLPGPP